MQTADETQEQWSKVKTSNQNKWLEKSVAKAFAKNMISENNGRFIFLKYLKNELELKLHHFEWPELYSIIHVPHTSYARAEEMCIPGCKQTWIGYTHQAAV